MKPHLQFKVLTLTASMIACLSMSTGVQANAYAVATDNIKDGAGFVGLDTNGDGIPDTLAPTSVISIGTPAPTSSSSATLGPIGSPATGSSGSDPHDAPASNGTGSSPLRTNEMTFVSGGGNTYYTLFGPLGSSYSAGDAKIVSEQVSLGSFIEARNVAETNIAGSGHGDADGRNISSTTITLPITIGSDCNTLKCAMSFSFKADPYMKALLDAAAPSGSVARATLAFNITLTKSGNVIPTFAWAPDGSLAPGGIFGGTELADAENLNGTTATQTAGATELYSPPYASDVFGSYFAYTNYLSSGTYELSLSMIEKTDATRQVPEPATLALMGISLVGFGYARRKRS